MIAMYVLSKHKNFLPMIPGLGHHFILAAAAMCFSIFSYTTWKRRFFPAGPSLQCCGWRPPLFSLREKQNRTTSVTYCRLAFPRSEQTTHSWRCARTQKVTIPDDEETYQIFDEWGYYDEWSFFRPELLLLIVSRSICFSCICRYGVWEKWIR